MYTLTPILLIDTYILITRYHDKLQGQKQGFCMKSVTVRLKVFSC